MFECLSSTMGTNSCLLLPALRTCTCQQPAKASAGTTAVPCARVAFMSSAVSTSFSMAQVRYSATDLASLKAWLSSSRLVMALPVHT